MKYANCHAGVFVRRLNRFVAEVEIDGTLRRAHMNNTGRCAELLIPGNRVYLEKRERAGRSTAYDLITVERRDARGLKLVNMDSLAPNRAAGEWLRAGGLGPLEELRAEATVGDSRFDFCAVQGGRRVAVEVKGCTLEADGAARFPDAPTLRGLKHVRGLTALAGEGWRCVVLIVIQMKGVSCFQPNWATQPAFGTALIEARAAGVEILAVDCEVSPGSVRIDRPVPMDLAPPEK